MVIEKQITVYICSYCQKIYHQKGDAEECETRCVKLSGSPEISILNLTSRTYNSLKIAGIDSVREVLNKTENELLKLRGFGQRCLLDLIKQLKPYGKLKEEPDKSWPLKKERRQRSLSAVSINENEEWINRSTDLPDELETEIAQFVELLDWVRLFKDYKWYNDTWEDGFPDILRLEKQFRASLQNGEIKRQDILDIANWGKFSYPPRIAYFKAISIDEEITLLQLLATLARGIGVTYISTVLRFAFPNRAGTLDSNIVRAFGIGDETVNQYHWLTFRTKKSRNGWAVFRDRTWHLEYQKWLMILSKMVSLVNDKGLFCPHPQPFLDTGLRTEGIWIVADVEMAVYSYVMGIITAL